MSRPALGQKGVTAWGGRLPDEKHGFEQSFVVLSEPRLLARAPSAYQSAYFNPSESKLLASASPADGAELWDVRRPLKSVLNQCKHAEICTFC